MEKHEKNLRKAIDQIQKMTNRALELRVDTYSLTTRVILANNVDYLEEIHRHRESQRLLATSSSPGSFIVDSPKL